MVILAHTHTHTHTHKKKKKREENKRLSKQPLPVCTRLDYKRAAAALLQVFFALKQASPAKEKLHPLL